MKRSLSILIIALSLLAFPAHAQVDEDQLGAWYMYFFNTRIGDGPWGFQGDGQFRNWDLGGDLEQLLLRGGLTYTPGDSNVLITLGYGNITSGAFGDDDSTTSEDRIYQEVLLPQVIAPKVRLRHRFRFEQRWQEDNDFRTRFRYALFLDVPLNRPDLKKGAVYLAFYNEIFINGQRDIGNDKEVDYFDRNRLYGAVGYSLTDRLRIQAGLMNQITDAVNKNQLQVSLHHSF